MKKCLFFLLLFVGQVVGFGQNLCLTTTDDAPGCIFRCNELTGNTAGFTEDGTSYSFDCGIPQKSQWISFIPENDFLKITADVIGCPLTGNIQAQFFDENFNSVSTCFEFDIRTVGSSLIADNLTSGDTYHLLINGSETTDCAFIFNIEGNQQINIPNTPSPTYSNSSNLFTGRVYIPLIPGAISYEWDVLGNTTLISYGQGTNEIVYQNPGNSVDRICVEPIYECQRGAKRCVILPFESCTSTNNFPPGCDFQCASIQVKYAEMSTNSFDSQELSDCNLAGANNVKTTWFSVIARGTQIRVDPFVTRWLTNSNGTIKIFDKNMNPVSNCVYFIGTTVQEAVVSGAIPGEKYTVGFGTSRASDNISEVTLRIYGTEQPVKLNPVIAFDSIVNKTQAFASIDPSMEFGFITWSIDTTNAQIISGQGTQRIEFSVTDTTRATNICVDVKTYGCGSALIGNNCKQFGQTPPPPPPFGGNPLSPCTIGQPNNGGGNDAPGCIMCGIDIYEGNTTGFGPSAPGSAGFPCGTIENNQFISFIAGSSGLVTIDLIADNCLNEQGLQGIIFDSDFNPVSNCFASGGTNIPGTITSGNLTPGEYYMLMIDGFAADVCNFTATFTGIASAGLLGDIGRIKRTPARPSYCQNDVVCFSINSTVGAASYDWEYPSFGSILSGGDSQDTSLCLTFPNFGTDTISVTAIAGCADPKTEFFVLNVNESASTQAPLISACANDFPIQIDGNTFDEFGTFDIYYNSQSGCDSIVTYTIEETTSPPNATPDNWKTTFCQNETTTYQITGGSPSDMVDWQITNGIILSGNGTEEIEVRWDNVGNGTLCAQYMNSCGNGNQYCENISINALPTSTFSTPSTICTNEQITITYTGNASPTANYNWDFGNASIISGNGAGPYEISFPDAGGYQIALEVEENGCLSPVTEQTIVVNAQLAPFSVNCNSTVDEIIFEWNAVSGATSYRINPVTGQTGNLNGTTYTVSGLSPNEEVSIEVFAESGVGCAASSVIKTCTAQNCPPVSVSISPVADICADAASGTIQLSAQQSGGSGNGIFEWSGTGISATGIFDPNAANNGSNQVQVRYSEGSCEYSATQNINVFNVPTADFDVSPVTCLSDNIDVIYSGSASSSANYNWDFGTATVVSGSGQGPYVLAPNTPGTLNISLQVNENGCASLTETKSVQVDDELDLLSISCLNATTNSLVFGWNASSGASSYTVQVTTGQQGVLNGTNYELTGLSPGEEVMIVVTANSSNSCAPVISTHTCVTIDCPVVTVSIDPISTNICAGDSLQIPLTATLDNASGTGTLTWSGQGVSSSGVWNTSGLSAGDYLVEVIYEETGCTYSQSQTLTISPNIDLSADIRAPIWYPGASGDIQLTASGGVPPYNYLWAPSLNTTPSLFDASIGEHCVTVTDNRGCETTNCYRIGAGIYRTNPLAVICSGDSKTLSVRPGRGADFAWLPSDGLSCTDCPSTVASPTQTTLYNVTATLLNGRFESTNIVVVVLPRLFCNMAKDLPENELSSLAGKLDLGKVEEKDLPKVENKIKAFLSKKAIKITPNPTSGEVRISSLTKVEKTEVFDFSGRKILVSDESEIDLSAFAKGVYFFKIKTEGNVVVKKVVLI